MRRLSTIALLLLLLAGWWWLQHPERELQPMPAQGAGALVVEPPATSGLPRFLPREARTTLDLIERNGPFPHRQDGSVFGNREGRLPTKPRGYYREYTVDTPGLGHRGARRIITGGQPPAVYYYTDDHYDSFRSFEPSP